MVRSSSTFRFIDVDFLTATYRMVGKIRVGNTGVIGLLNDPTTSFMEVQEVSLARMHMPDKLVDRFSVLRLVKSQILAVCLSRREDVGPQSLARGGYEKVYEYPIRVITTVYEIEGILHWTGRLDFSAIMIEGTRNFIPIYTAHLSSVLIPTMNLETPALLFNRMHLESLALTDHRSEE